MILDKLNNKSYYANVHPLFPEVFAYVESYLCEPVAPGIYEISGKNLFVKVQDYETREEGFLEVHDQYIDVQCMIEGVEKVYITDREGLVPACEYDVQEDALFLKDRDGCRDFLFQTGEFAVFFPQDAHKPAMCIDKPERVRKLVFKVRV